MAATLTIGYDATAAVRQQAGIGRYARELLLALSRLPNGDRYRVAYCAHGAHVALPPLGNQFVTAPIPLSDRVANALWQRCRIPVPIELRTGRLDVLHAPDFSVPPSLAPAIVTVHDLAFEMVPSCSYPTLRAYLQRVVPRAVRHARAVIAVSEATKRDLIACYGLDETRIRVIPEGVSPLFGPRNQEGAASTAHRLGIEGPFVLAVGTLEPRKNYERLLEAHAILRQRGHDRRLVIAGRYGWLYDSIFERQRALGLGDSVLFLTDVQDQELADLYNSAEVAVFPSLYEGFGLPALEALACGCPLACSRSSSLPEIVDGAAALFDPESVHDIVGTLESLLLEPDRQQELRRAGPLRAASFTWEEAARQTHELYHAVADG